jgi:hypothetical protein
MFLRNVDIQNPQKAVPWPVIRWPVTAEARDRFRISECGICGQSGTGTGFSPSSSGFPVNIIPPWLSMFMYHLGDKQYGRWWQQFTDIFSPH